MKAVFKRELKSYFQGFTGYLFIAFLLLIIGIVTVLNNLRNASPKFEYVLADVGFVFLLTVPMLTMRVFSEEKRQKTDQLLYSLPLKTTDIVFGKYFAMLTILAIPTLVMCFYPLILSSYGPIGFLTAYSSIFAFFLQGAGLIAIGMFVSSLTENQIVSAGLSFAVLLVLFLMPTFVFSLSASAWPLLSLFGLCRAHRCDSLVHDKKLHGIGVGRHGARPRCLSSILFPPRRLRVLSRELFTAYRFLCGCITSSRAYSTSAR